jgi:rhomboid protease GluP
MSEDGLHPLETILQLCAAAAPEPWYPRLYAKQEGVDQQALAQNLEELWQSGLIERGQGSPETGPAITLTREGQRVLLDPEALQRLRDGEPVSANDRGAIIRQALSRRMRPSITRFLLAVNIFLFLAGYYTAWKMGADSAFLRGSPITVQVAEVLDKSGALSPVHLIEGEWWRLLTAGFVHVGFLHLLLNLVFLYLAGRFVESMWGHLRYLLIYLASVLGGSCLGLAHDVGSITSASDAVCGLIGAEAVWVLFNRRYLPRALLRPMRTSLIVTVLLLIFIGSFRNVGVWGLIGGAAAGALSALLLHLHRFGPPGWRWLAILGFAPLIWYGQFAIEYARATDPKWLAIEDQQFVDRHAGLVQKVMNQAREVYVEKVIPVLEIHPTRRDPAKVEALWPILNEQKRELTSVADGLARAGPYHSPDAELAREVGRQYLLAGVELFNLAENLLRQGEKRTDKDRRALREQEKQVEERRKEWRKLFE